VNRLPVVTEYVCSTPTDWWWMIPLQILRRSTNAMPHALGHLEEKKVLHERKRWLDRRCGGVQGCRGKAWKHCLGLKHLAEHAVLILAQHIAIERLTYLVITIFAS